MAQETEDIEIPSSVFVSTKGKIENVNEPYKDSRVIIKCIGRLNAWYGDYNDNNKKKIIYSGTGTVYDVQDGYAYVITCEHNVNQAKEMEIKPAETISFYREESEKEPIKYDAKIVDVRGYFEKDEIEEAVIARRLKNLAILRFKDHDKFYTNLFKNNKDIINLGCINDVNDDEKEDIQYSIYGYSVDSKVLCGKYTLWGLSTPFNEVKKIVLKEKIQAFKYNTIDENESPSGAAIWVKKNNTYKIIGVHTEIFNLSGEGIALNNDKIKWIKSSQNDKQDVVNKIEPSANTDDSKSNQDDEYNSFEIEISVPFKRVPENKINEENDRREEIDKISGLDNKGIYGVGKVKTWYGNKKLNKKKKEVKDKFRGTGNVFCVKDGRAYVITCGHTLTPSPNDTRQKKTEEVTFVRYKKGKIAKEYEVNIDDIHIYGDYEKSQKDQDDFGLISFKDDGYYSKYFKDGQVDELFCTDDIQKDDNKYDYQLYGLPADHGNQLSGMTVNSGDTKNDDDDDAKKADYVRFDQKTGMYKYNAIDTTGGQSGSVLWRKGKKDDKYKMVSVHTLGFGEEDVNENSGVALTKEKIEWIMEKIKNNNK